MNELDSKKLEFTKKYLENKEKIDDLNHSKRDFLAIMGIMLLSIVPLALFLEWNFIIAAIIVGSIPGEISLICQAEINSVKRKCLDSNTSLKEFNKFLKSDEFNSCVEHLKKQNLENVEYVKDEQIEEDYVDVLKEYSYYDDETLNVYGKKVSKENNNNRR